ncbi:MAG: AbrB/MazE/SpoVT family DNA-binding domain-containing protein [Burkholderiaceae bacterium]|jgi:bifunctional DNA-binding transcriptional regulator/antitoxin component of YhaV-PrlF toxin-antitoxin module|nr:AbrB/MazE/SpoVT family DNA-binding domain-containing protein [Burkholderiaceae bacterium]
MSHTQVRVRVRNKHQITLPASVVRAASIGVNDVLDVSCKDGVITLLTQRMAEKKRPSLMDLAGSLKDSGYWRNAEEIHAYIAGERKSWERPWDR